jgi:hypothetical protein
MPMTTGGEPNWTAWGIITLVVIGLVLYVWFSWQASRPFRIEGSTSLTLDGARDRIIEGYIQAGWSATPLSDGRVLFARTTRPDLAITILLGFFVILPALIYIVSSQKRQSAEMRLSQVGSRGSVVVITGNTTGFGGVQTAAMVLRSLPKS